MPLLLLSGCRTKYIATEYHSTDTLKVTDTLYIERVVSVSAVQVDSCTTNEAQAAKIKITDFDSVGNITRVTDIDYSAERNSKSGGNIVTSSASRDVVQASHNEQAASTTDIITKEIKVPYIPKWVTAIGIIVVLVFSWLVFKVYVNKK